MRRRYCIGWLFRRVLRLILVVSVLAIALLAYGKFTGWDMTHTQEQVQHSGEWARHNRNRREGSSQKPAALGYSQHGRNVHGFLAAE